MPNTAQSDLVQQDTTREEAIDQRTEREQTANGQAVIFAPAQKRRTIQAIEISDKLKIDGRLDEADWLRGKPARKFVQVDPKQGRPATFDTDVRVLYNRHYLYISAINHDPLGRRGLRSPNFKRDFSNQAHDLFG